jgi:hypothetical protein
MVSGWPARCPITLVNYLTAGSALLDGDSTISAAPCYINLNEPTLISPRIPRSATIDNRVPNIHLTYTHFE